MVLMGASVCAEHPDIRIRHGHTGKIAGNSGHPGRVHIGLPVYNVSYRQRKCGCALKDDTGQSDGFGKLDRCMDGKFNIGTAVI